MRVEVPSAIATVPDGAVATVRGNSKNKFTPLSMRRLAHVVLCTTCGQTMAIKAKKVPLRALRTLATPIHARGSLSCCGVYSHSARQVVHAGGTWQLQSRGHPQPEHLAGAMISQVTATVIAYVHSCWFKRTLISVLTCRFCCFVRQQHGSLRH